MPYLRLRLYKPNKLISAQNAPLHLCLVGEGYFLDDLSVSDEGQFERPSKARVIFAEVTRAEDARLVYDGRWTDPSNSQTTPGTVHLYLPLDQRIEAYFDANDFDAQFLVLTLYIRDELRATITMGASSDCPEISWDTAVTKELSASIQWISADMEPRPAPEPIVADTTTPPLWQTKAVSNFEDAALKQLMATEDIRRLLRSIRIILLLLGLCALLILGRLI